MSSAATAASGAPVAPSRDPLLHALGSGEELIKFVGSLDGLSRLVAEHPRAAKPAASAASADEHAQRTSNQAARPPLARRAPVFIGGGLALTIAAVVMAGVQIWTETDARITARLEAGDGAAVPLNVLAQEFLARLQGKSAPPARLDAQLHRDDATTAPPESSPHEETVQLVSSNPVTAASSELPQAAAASPPAMVADRPTGAVPSRRSAADVAFLIGRAKQMLVIGDIAAARLFLVPAAESEDAEAALLLGKTYDPVWLRAAGATASLANLDKAAEWYRNAAAGGAVKAAELLTRLGK